MSRMCVLMPRLQLVEPSSGPWAPTWSGDDTTWSDWREPTSSSSVPESLRTLQCFERSVNGACAGSASLSSPFGSSLVH